MLRPRRDDGLGATSVQGTLALEVDSTREPPASAPTTALRGADVVDVPAVVRRDLQRWVHTFSQAVSEVTTGSRPVSQLLRWTTPAVHNELAYRAGVVSRARVHQGGKGPSRHPAVRPQVRSEEHTSELPPLMRL